MRRVIQAMMCLELVSVAACQSWHSIPLAPDAARDLPENSRVVTSGGRTLPVRDAHIDGSHVAGVMPDGERISLPRDSVSSIQVRRLSWPRTLGAVYGGLFAVGLMIGEKI
jgi:hypothetical protein